MRVQDHRLVSEPGTDAPFQPSPNVGGPLQPEYLVIHYTAGRSAEESIGWLCDSRSRASAHVVIGRDGAVTQLVPFDQIAWHAGRSAWEGRTGLNRFSLGIELDNAGRLTRRKGAWHHWTGSPRYDDAEVLEATHRHESAPCGWHAFPPAQLDAALEVAAALVERYGLRDVLGHDDVSPGRKSDPGPAFPMQSFRSRVFGRQEEEADTHRTTTELNVRTGPGGLIAAPAIG
jgi:N-acetylmuramoyl-L-alanine amidase